MPSSAKTSILRAALVASTQQSTTVTMFSPSKSFPHYIFGYGSLICPDSRAVTAPSLQGRYATPVIIQHWERTWSCPYKPCGMTFLGIQAAPNRNCVGVLVPVTEDELEAFDDREAGYDRVSIPLKDIRPYEQKAGKRTMNEKEQYTYFQQVEDQQNTGDDTTTTRLPAPQVWVYVPQNHLPTNVECPLAQTYIDIILRGCLAISVDFCQQVLQSTRGWDARDHDGNDQGDKGTTTKTMTGKRKNATIPTAESTIANPGHSNDDDLWCTLSQNKTVFWVDDRLDPLYVRADADYSRQHADLIDGLIRRHRPEICYRITYERETLLDEHE